MTLPDLRGLLAALADGGVEHVVVGGIALGLHGYIRATADLDIVPAPEAANLDRLVRMLESAQATLTLKPYHRFGPREAWLLRRGRNLSVSTPHGDLDVIRALPGVPDYARLRESAERYDVDGLVVAAASPALLIEMKQARGSAQDRADVEALRELEDA